MGLITVQRYCAACDACVVFEMSVFHEAFVCVTAIVVCNSRLHCVWSAFLTTELSCLG